VGVYFFLKDDCYLVKGARGGAVYNLMNGSVHSIDPIAVKLIEACEKGEKISRVSSRIPDIGFTDALAYLNRLDSEDLGNFYSGPKEVEKRPLSSSHDKLDFIWLELREDCNQRCRHCYSQNNPPGTAERRLKKGEWMRVIYEAAGLGCQALQFIGGEPLLYGEDLFSIAERARKCDYKDIQLFSNLNILKDEWVDQIVEFGISVSTSIYSKRPEIHDQITRVKGSHTRLLANCRKLEKKGVNVRYCILVMKHNQDVVDETMAFLKELGMEDPQYGILRPSGGSIDSELVPDKFISEQKEKDAVFFPVNKGTFLWRFRGNACWRGKVDITSTGDVFPCIMQRNESCGNVRENSLKDIIWGKKLQRFWRLSLDQIEVCKDCEYRYVCHACQPVCYGSNGNHFCRKPWCHYNPYEERHRAPLSMSVLAPKSNLRAVSSA
jgi:radical SAM protein with 4Fe4S-binding SPASM domain